MKKKTENGRQKIIINGRFLSQKMTGVNRFAFEICKGLHRLGLNFMVIAPQHILQDYVIDFPVSRWGVLSGPAWEMIDLPLYLCTHGRPLLLGFSGLGPLHYKNQVITIHDLAYLENPHWYSFSYYHFYKFCTPVIARNAKKIITVSRFSKTEIIKHLGIRGEKIHVVSNAVDFTSVAPIRPPIPVKKYILSVGSLDPRKNLLMITEAFKQSGLSSAFQLVLAGKGDKIFQMVSSSDITAHLAGYVTDSELVWLYSNASVFVYPSLFEGFGIPPLEAMKLGCPVVLSDIPVFRELFEGAAIFVDPYDPGSIANGIIQILDDDALRTDLIRKGREKASEFSWEKSAQGIMKILEDNRFKS